MSESLEHAPVIVCASAIAGLAAMIVVSVIRSNEQAGASIGHASLLCIEAKLQEQVFRHHGVDSSVHCSRIPEYTMIVCVARSSMSTLYFRCPKSDEQSCVPMIDEATR